jgi:sulfite exporter TauE/SafE
LEATLAYCFLLGLLHGIVPDEHTWPITFSYAIGSGSSAEGMRTGIYFAAAFTLQRTLLSELAYLALAPFLRSPAVNSVVYVIVGVAMSLAGWLVLHPDLCPHLDLLGHHHRTSRDIEPSAVGVTRARADNAGGRSMPVRWALIHGFIAGFGFCGFGLFVNAVAAPAMPSAWFGFLPGFLFGAGTLVTLAVLGRAFVSGLRLMGGLREEDAQRFGARVGATTLFAGGFVFMAGGLAIDLGLDRYVPVDIGYLLIALLVVAVAIPAFVRAWRDLAVEANPLGTECLRDSVMVEPASPYTGREES